MPAFVHYWMARAEPLYLMLNTSLSRCVGRGIFRALSDGPGPPCANCLNRYSEALYAKLVADNALLRRFLDDGSVTKQACLVASRVNRVLDVVVEHVSPAGVSVIALGWRSGDCGSCGTAAASTGQLQNCDQVLGKVVYTAPLYNGTECQMACGYVQDEEHVLGLCSDPVHFEVRAWLC